MNLVGCFGGSLSDNLLVLGLFADYYAPFCTLIPNFT